MENQNVVGKTYQMNNGSKLEIIDYISYKNITVKFDNGFILKNVGFGHIKTGYVKNPLTPVVRNFGYIGIGKHLQFINGVATKKYTVWQSMINRVFDKKFHARQPAYIGTQIFKGWANFQTFGDWFDENYIDGFVLDKDILVKGNKAYHPFRCCFVPQEINGLFISRKSERGDLPIGVIRSKGKFVGQLKENTKTISSPYLLNMENAFEWYKENKELNIKRFAEKWKYSISEKVYNALVNYIVEITD
jgi:hypothetical protein